MRRLDRDYVIFESATGFPVDVITHLCCAIGMTRLWMDANPGIEFDYREATLKESANAHIIQLDAMREQSFVDPAEING